MVTKAAPVNFSFSGFSKIMRVPNLFIIILTQYMTAVFLIGAHNSRLYILLDYKLFLLCLSTTLIAAAGYIINDYYDVKIDYINKPEEVIVGKVLKRRVVMVTHTLLNIMGIAIASFLSLKIGLFTFITAFILWLYSNQLKRLPFIGNFIIALVTASALGILTLLYPYGQQAVFIYAAFAFTLTLIREIIKDMEDLKGDANFGCKTLPIIWGVRKTKLFIYLLSILFIIGASWLGQELNRPAILLYFGILAVPYSFFIYQLIMADTKKEFKYLSTFCKYLMISGILSMIFF
jgi:4-hydroxybenzoate polyprenyltransferase